jgi:hypothetical protein
MCRCHHQTARTLPVWLTAEDAGTAVAILTEWNEFRALNLERMKAALKAPVLVDLRNIYNPEEMADAGFRYGCIGRPVPKSDSCSPGHASRSAKRPRGNYGHDEFHENAKGN